MQKVDRLGWAAGFSIKSYGVRIGIRSNDPSCLKRARNHLPHGWELSSSPVVDRLYSLLIDGTSPRANVRRFNLLYGDHIRLARSVDLEQIFERFESDLRLFVAELARRRVFVHAGVVGWKGKAIVVPGRSFSGKSSLVAALVSAGATYYSDEYAVFDSRGRVHPFPKALEIRDQGDTRQTKVTIEELGGQAGIRPLPVGLVVMTQFKAGATWRPRKLTPGKGVLELLSNTVSARREPEKALVTLQHVVASAEVVKGARGECRDIVKSILNRVER